VVTRGKNYINTVHFLTQTIRFLSQAINVYLHLRVIKSCSLSMLFLMNTCSLSFNYSWHVIIIQESHIYCSHFCALLCGSGYRQVCVGLLLLSMLAPEGQSRHEGLQEEVTDVMHQICEGGVSQRTMRLSGS